MFMQVDPGLAALTTLQKLYLRFDCSTSLSDVSPVGTALASLKALQELSLSFYGCSQLPEGIQKRFDSRQGFS